ncbi:CASP-like protein 2C1 [Magnolia sinica]|uniref:CASP-like protein 2C1 n=1 Tax=Magnolia sinica TaxID=86752 RepID=UPI002657C2E0|nr:CASP-like protein 2C1 [Magnolia sinica]XP_058067937.1 CASP-like protein 2C1 [Magnolia sinica]
MQYNFSTWLIKPDHISDRREEKSTICTHKMEKISLLKAEGFLRIFSLFLAISCACLVGLDTQTKQIFLSVERKATRKDVPALSVLVIVEAIAAGYHFVQLCKCMVFARFKQNPSENHNNLAWICFISDQTVAYVSFAATSAAAQASMLAVTGASHFQWMKLCPIYTRFCDKIAGGLICALLATLLTVAVSSISAFHLFRRYSPKQFLILKGGLS